MQDLIETFEWRGERAALYFSYEALYELEKRHGLVVGDLWEQVKNSSCVAQTAALVVGLEEARKKIDGFARATKWTAEDAKEMYMGAGGFGPKHCAQLITDALSRVLVPRAPEDLGEGKAPAPPSTGSESR